MWTKQDEAGTDGAAAGAGGKPAGAAPAGTPATDGGKPADGKPAGEAKPEGKPADGAKPAAPAVPDKYELKLPEGALLQPAAIERTAATAKALGLSQENAQKALDFAHGEVKAYHDSLLNDHQARTAQWAADAKADKVLAGEKGDQFEHHVRLAMNAFKHWFGDALVKEMEATGFGNHPAVLRGFLKIAQAMADDKFVTGNQGGTPPARDAATVLYGGDSTP
ncbi:MAG TPA: hypothetical protein VNK91_01915 [Burkholderiaceae bacterium]|nr:hypothetical protein [Burkholderiaceae bacterium]